MPPFGEADRRREPPCPPLKSVTARGLQRPRGEGGKRAGRAAGGRGASARKRSIRRVGREKQGGARIFSPGIDSGTHAA